MEKHAPPMICRSMKEQHFCTQVFNSVCRSLFYQHHAEKFGTSWGTTKKVMADWIYVLLCTKIEDFGPTSETHIFLNQSVMKRFQLSLKFLLLLLDGTKIYKSTFYPNPKPEGLQPFFVLKPMSETHFTTVTVVTLT